MEAFDVLETLQEPRSATLVGSLVTPLDQLTAAAREHFDALDVLEVRADLAGDLKASDLRQWFRGRLLYTLRSSSEWGQGPDAAAERAPRLLQAAAGYDYVDLEANRDLTAEVLEGVPPRQRLLSWHGAHDADLRGVLERMDAYEAAVRKLVVLAQADSQEVAVMTLLCECRDQGRSDVVAFAAGDCGTWTRLVAPRVGLPWVYVALDQAAAPGQLSLAQALRDYGLPSLPPARRVFGILGRPVSHSLSPRLHNGGYRATETEALYLPFHAERFADFWMDTVEIGIFDRLGLPLEGLSVTTPYKEPALAVAGASSPRAARLRAGNTLLLRKGVWECVSTDPEGVVVPLQRLGVSLEGAPAAVVGCGGAGRAAALGLRECGAEVSVVNRTEEKGRMTAERLGLEFIPLAELDPSRYQVMVQATALGSDASDPLPWSVESMRDDAVLVEMVYRSGETPLEGAARARGLRTIGGRQVLLFQGLEQFRLMVGRELDAELGGALLGLEEAR
ncbi:MAG: type I 3-dehydroquinate dehydratase [Acidobacteriota bacterium]